MAYKVAIIGGYGGMGRLLATLFKSEGCPVTLTGPTPEKGEAAARELGVEYTRDNAAAAKAADIVVVTVPIAATAETIRQVAPLVRPGGMIMDLTSIKEEPCRLMASFAPEGVEVVGTHPVFGPRVGSVDGQVFVLTPVRGVKWADWLRGVLLRHNARVVESTPEEHDEVMAVVQGLTHYTYICIGKTLKDLDFDVKRSRQFSSPVYDLMLDMVGRIIGQDPHLYAEIQMQNPRNPGIHDVFLSAADEVSSAVKERREKDFVRMMADAARHFGDTERSMGRSDKAIGSLVSELKALQDSVGREICLRHIYSGAVHIGVVVHVSAEEVELSSGGRSSRLKLSNLQVMSREECSAQKRRKYGTVKRDFSVVLNESADDGFLCALLCEHCPCAVLAQVKDVFRGEKIGSGRKSVCFSVEMIQDDLKANEASVAEFFRGIGGSLR
jgi:prephenate dehydrogenase